MTGNKLKIKTLKCVLKKSRKILNYVFMCKIKMFIYKNIENTFLPKTVNFSYGEQLEMKYAHMKPY